MRTAKQAAAAWEGATIAKSGNYSSAAARQAAAFVDGYSAITRCNGKSDWRYDLLRESYATGRITLGEFEAEVTILLRDAA